MAPALPVFAAAAAPTGVASTPSQRSTCGSGRAREAGYAEDGTGFAGVRGRGRSHRCSVNAKPAQYLWERACREAGDAVDGTGCAGVRGRGRSHRCNVNAKPA